MAKGSRFLQPWTQNLGRDGWDQPQAIPENMSAESFNIELREGGLGKKRSGTEKITLGGAGPTGGTGTYGVYLPSNNIANAELWIVGVKAAVSHLFRIPGDANSAVDLGANGNNGAVYAQLNNKFFIARNSSTDNRLTVYNPAESTTAVRFAGLKPEAAPTVADTGIGTYAAIPRTYRVVTLLIVGGVVQAQSNPSSTVAFTPSGVGTAARVTKGAASGDGETHWRVEAAAADGVYWIISGNIVVGTTTYDDSVVPSQYSVAGTVPPPIGSNYPFPSVRYLISDGIRLYGLGVWATSVGDSVAPVAGRLYFTPAIGSSNMGDDERIINNALSSGWIDLSIGGGGDDRGLGLINNSVAAFQYRGVYRFIPTNNADVPLRRVLVDPSVGSISGSSIIAAKDSNGDPALYFLDPTNGPYRMTNGYVLQWIGKDVKDLWNTADISISTYEASFDGDFDSTRNLIVWTFPKIGGGVETITFDVTNGVVVANNEVRRGWARWSTLPGSMGVMFPSALTSPRPYTFVMYLTGGNGTMYRFMSSLTQDDGTNYQAYVRSKAYWWAPMGRLKKLLSAIVIAKSTAATTIRALFIPNWGEQTGVTQDISVAAVGSAAYVRPRPNPVDSTDLNTLQVEVGDAAAANNTWELESTEIQLETLEDAQ